MTIPDFQLSPLESLKIEFENSNNGYFQINKCHEKLIFINSLFDELKYVFEILNVEYTLMDETKKTSIFPLFECSEGGINVAQRKEKQRVYRVCSGSLTVILLKG